MFHGTKYTPDRRKTGQSAEGVGTFIPARWLTSHGGITDLHA
jgi:hypothetical protein